MGAYENGITTRRVILDVSKKLFYAQGVHETTFDDICREAHVNRGSIYYHFKEKENIRYEVIWEHTQRNLNTAKKLCQDSRIAPSLAMYLLWQQIWQDGGVRRFYMEYFRDFPAYVPEANLSTFFRTLNNYLHSTLWGERSWEDLTVASLYGYLLGLLVLANQQPAWASAEELFRQSFAGCNRLWGKSEQEVEAVWQEIAKSIAQLPPDWKPEPGL